jgi:hypothetical protein
MAKITPPTHSSRSPEEAARAFNEGELAQKSSYPDIGARTGSVGGERHITEAVREAPDTAVTAVENRIMDADGRLPQLDPQDIVGREGLPAERMQQLQQSPLSVNNKTFTPAQAHTARLAHEAPNALGKPAVMNDAEALLREYQEARTAWREQYSRTRDNSGEERFIAAKQAMMRAGQLPPDA